LQNDHIERQTITSILYSGLQAIGGKGKQLILEGGKWDVDLYEQVKLNNERFSLNLGGIEIERFSNRSCRLVLGSAEQRAHQYESDDFFCICNYEQVLRDYLSIERVQWDLIIIDEGQRIKSREAKTSRMVKALKSTFALVLSGTPLENRIDELFSVVEFIDDRRLGPAFQFFNRHKVVDEKGKVLGYKNLDQLRKKLKPLMLRRTRQQVMADLPPRTTDILRRNPIRSPD